MESNTRFWHGWRERARALRNVPALMRIVWESGPTVVAAGWAFRILGALVPIAMLSVAKLIFDAIQVRTGGGPLGEHFWWLVGLECVLAVVGAVLGRVIWFFDALLADRFTRHVSVRVMEHASRLDLTLLRGPRLPRHSSSAPASRPPTASRWCRRSARSLQQLIVAVDAVAEHPVLLAVAACWRWCWP